MPIYPGWQGRGTTVNEGEPGKQEENGGRGRTLSMLSGFNIASGLPCFSAATYALERSVRITPSMIACATWMFSFPNSFARLCDGARRPNLPAAKALVVVFPRRLTGRRAGEEQRALLAPRLVDGEVFERGDGFAGEREGADNVGVDALLGFFGLELEE
ncbi:hypothetical protein FIBSPDRAFT_219473 [Athelia psychrophila]|uniref:Uncharacterized protein n=1 Tax=Athelia psychrophila TaxID=1759441 RepID=A0A165Z8F9_9AGAM|nr:hypothetical protein FIBSPDRAFT_219473 [Fibularhizoctonia sp. CBS 109695]